MDTRPYSERMYEVWERVWAVYEKASLQNVWKGVLCCGNMFDQTSRDGTMEVFGLCQQKLGLAHRNAESDEFNESNTWVSIQ